MISGRVDELLHDCCWCCDICSFLRCDVLDICDIFEDLDPVRLMRIRYNWLKS